MAAYPGCDAMGELTLIRHGETQWSASGQHTGVTDIPLTPTGEQQVSRLRPLLDGHRFGQVLTSPMLRARRTAELLGLTGAEVDPDLAEWDYGGYEGLTTDEISAELGQPWRIWTHSVPAGPTPGEAIEQVAKRADRILARVRPVLAQRQDVALVGHGHNLRVLAARWLDLKPQAGAWLSLSAGSLSGLGYEHDRPVILYWNLSRARLGTASR
jgi:broad specificity phosphatase PhoE